DVSVGAQLWVPPPSRETRLAPQVESSDTASTRESSALRAERRPRIPSSTVASPARMVAPRSAATVVVESTGPERTMPRPYPTTAAPRTRRNPASPALAGRGLVEVAVVLAAAYGLVDSCVGGGS